MFEKSADKTTIHVPPVSKPTKTALERFAPIYADEYDGFKRDFLSWLLRKGKNPFKGDGYAKETVKTTHYKIEKAYRWKWEQDSAFTKEFTPDDAEAFIDLLVAETTLHDREVRDYIKALKRLFRWFNDARGTEYEWDYSKLDQLQQQGASKRRHYFEEYEMAELYDAAIEYGSVKSYHAVSPEERDRIKRHLSQQMTKPKDEITPVDFDKANSWKFPALLAVSIDLGLRPIEIERSNTGWVRLTDKKVVIPRDEASKEKDPWECVLSSRAVRALKRWTEERRTYEKYDDTDALWLTKYGNPYTAHSLNGLLNRLLDETDIKPQGRELTWYSIRRGAATMWTENADLEKAADQLRHKKLETTRRYMKSNTRGREEIVEDNW
jgi:site-specific recombinase XerD